MASNSTTPSQPEGFTFKARKSGDVEVLHHGTLATVLRAKDAQAFLAKAANATEAEVQHLLARLTGNYKRGNERLASTHTRNQQG